MVSGLTPNVGHIVWLNGDRPRLERGTAKIVLGGPPDKRGERVRATLLGGWDPGRGDVLGQLRGNATVDRLLDGVYFF